MTRHVFLVSKDSDNCAHTSAPLMKPLTNSDIYFWLGFRKLGYFFVQVVRYSDNYS